MERNSHEIEHRSNDPPRFHCRGAGHGNRRIHRTTERVSGVGLRAVSLHEDLGQRHPENDLRGPTWIVRVEIGGGARHPYHRPPEAFTRNRDAGPVLGARDQASLDTVRERVADLLLDGGCAVKGNAVGRGSSEHLLGPAAVNLDRVREKAVPLLKEPRKLTATIAQDLVHVRRQHLNGVELDAGLLGDDRSGVPVERLQRAVLVRPQQEIPARRAPRDHPGRSGADAPWRRHGPLPLQELCRDGSQWLRKVAGDGSGPDGSWPSPEQERTWRNVLRSTSERSEVNVGRLPRLRHLLRNQR